MPRNNPEAYGITLDSLSGALDSLSSKIVRRYVRTNWNSAYFLEELDKGIAAYMQTKLVEFYTFLYKYMRT